MTQHQTTNNNTRQSNPATQVTPVREELQAKLREEEAKLRLSDADLQFEESSGHRFDPTGQNEQSTNTTDKVEGKRTCPFSFVPLKLEGRTHKPSKSSKRLIRDEVSLEHLQKMTDLFYEKAFQDATLDKFIRSHDDPHGTRFARWIHQKLSGSNVWDLDRRARGRHEPVHDRTSAHVAAWYSPKRPSFERGRHFQLDECRVWMRLHFWAMRESGMMEQSPSFANFYVRFIGHFVNVYESTAPAFARDSLRWSADPKNIQEYIANGRCMVDVLGLSLEEAEAQIPENETNDFVWPYNQLE